MANKTIISTRLPDPSRRIIGGSSQRSKLRSVLQEPSGWKYNHAPPDASEKENARWWKTRANRYDTPLSSSGDVLYTRQTVKRELARLEDRQRVVDYTVELTKPYHGGDNSIFNKKPRMRDLTFGSFESELDITTEAVPGIKKRVSFTATKSGVGYAGEQITPFSAFSSSVTSGYRATLDSAGLGNIDLTNFHQDSILSYGKETPMQGPFTERFVGGVQARHNAPLRSIDRREDYVLSFGGTYASAPFNVISDGGFDKNEYDELTLTFTIGGVTYSAEVDKDLADASTTKSVIGVAGAGNEADVAASLAISLNLAITEDGLPITAVQGGGVLTYRVTVTSTALGDSYNDTEVGGTWNNDSLLMSGLVFAGGSNFTGSIETLTTQNTPKGHYLRGAGPKAPVNIRNIQTLTSSAVANGVSVVGNYIKNYEVLQGNDRANTNIDFIYNNDNYSYTAPSAFLTSPERAALGLTGSADYPAPRQISNRRTNQTIISGRFAAPGSKFDSKQQFRDVNSDQFAPNNALPYRNMEVRGPFSKDLGTYTGFGGYLSSSTTPAIVQTQRNETQRVEILSTDTLTYHTAAVYDTAYVTRPVPAGDSTQWFMDMSGSNTNTYSLYVLSGSRYPDNILRETTTLPSGFVGGSSVYTNAGGQTKYIWANSPFVPWTQTRLVNKNEASYYRRNNVYEILPQISSITTRGMDSPIEHFAGATLSRTSADQAGNNRTFFYSKRYIEAPLTSRYKPLIHQIQTFVGSPSTTTNNPIQVRMKYSYGNSLMGFAHRELNQQLVGNLKFSHNKVKRPYEILRDQTADGVPGSVNGVQRINLFVYPETIYPREVVTYLSGTRSRLSYKNSFWKDDQTTPSYSSASIAAFTLHTDLTSINNISLYNKGYPRLESPFITSQGYAVQASEQTPYNPTGALGVGSGPGSGSIWPLDSFIWSDYTSNLSNIEVYGMPMLLADAGTMASGELMMTQYGTVKDSVAAASPSMQATYTTSSVNSAQYVYNVPVYSTTIVSTAATAATAAITASIYQGQGNGAAEGQIVMGAVADGAAVDGQEFTVQDVTNTYVFEFDVSTASTSFTAGTKTYTIGVSGSANGSATRDLLYAALSDSRTTPTVPLDIAAPSKDGSYTIELTAGTAGTTFNSKDITWSGGAGSGGASVTTWHDGSDYNLNALTLKLNDNAHGTVTYTFNSSVQVAASNETTIGCQDATSVANVKNAINQTVALSYLAGNINIIAITGSGGALDLVATVAGTAMNTAPVTGSFIATGPPYGTRRNFGGGVAGTSVVSYTPRPRSAGSVYSRPPWTAGTNRRYVDGPAKGQIAASVFPFYDTYEKYAEDVRLIGKEYTLVPEYRVSEHVAEYTQNASVLSVVSSSLEITGANSTNYSGQNSDFYTRYAITDDIEFLGNFMSLDQGNRNYIFNKFPRHFEMSSDAIIKLLPYEGFYPVKRTLELAQMFSSSYAENAIYEGEDSALTEAWRTLMRPFYSPGIMYNAIKSGMAVDYPIRRGGRNLDQYVINPVVQGNLYNSLGIDCLSGTLVTVQPGQIPGNTRRSIPASAWANSDINKFFWADRLPFESILSPEDFLRHGFDQPTVLSDMSYYLGRDVSGSISDKALDSSFYKKAVSNFLANVPQFFLKNRKENKYGTPGYLTKFVSQFGEPAKGNQQVTSAVRRVTVDPSVAYMMEIGLLKTDGFNFYSNPYAFGIPTASGSSDWSSATSSWSPAGATWPHHRGEFAPFTPPHYYGPSLMRVTFMPSGQKTEYTLDEILNNDEGEVFVRFLNESGSYYDAASGSFITRDDSNVTVSSSVIPHYGWNRAWQNRMDMDASINVSNEFPTGQGGVYRSKDPNKWTIMPKWEAPILDFPNRDNSGDIYNFSSSISTSAYVQETQGVWHQYGVMPQNEKGTYLYIKDIPTGKEEEYDLVAIASAGSSAHTTGSYEYVRKIPPYVSDSGREVGSLADLCGFDSEEIIRAGFDPNKAKRMGELALDSEKSISEAILALPFYLDDEGTPTLMTLRAPANKLGPKIKEFRKKFTKFSLPPALSLKLLGMVPKGYPNISDTIDPFGPDQYDEILSGESMSQTPVVYLMEHKVNLTRQDLSDIWQGIMPEMAQRLKFSLSAVDHYMPGDNVEDSTTQFPEVLKEQINLGVARTGHPRYDLLDVAESCKKGFFPGIKWLVFKVKERGIVDYAQMIMEEVDGPEALSIDNVRGLYNLQGLPRSQVDKLLEDQDEFAKNVYITKHSLSDPTYNWPYDYCSLIETAKINTKIGFRPDLEEEYNSAQQSSHRQGAGETITNVIENIFDEKTRSQQPAGSQGGVGSAASILNPSLVGPFDDV